MLTILVQGPYLENFCPLYPVLAPISQQPECLQDAPLNSIYAWHYRPEAVSTSLGICWTNSTKLTSVLLEDSRMSTLSSWAISRSLQHDFLKDREHLIMNITCLHIHHVPHCTQTHIWSMHTEILIERDDVKYKLIVRYPLSVLWKITLGILFSENANLEAISKGQPWQPVNCPLSLEINISGLEDWGKNVS